MAIRIRQVEEPFSPRGVPGRTVRRQARRDGMGVEGINIGDVEDDPAPPRPLPAGGLGDQVQVAGPGVEAGEGGCLTAMAQAEAERLIEPHRASHVRGGQADRADALDRWRSHVLLLTAWLGFHALSLYP